MVLMGQCWKHLVFRCFHEVGNLGSRLFGSASAYASWFFGVPQAQSVIKRFSVNLLHQSAAWRGYGSSEIADEVEPFGPSAHVFEAHNRKL